MHQQYENPLIERYSSSEMSGLFSPDKKFRTWRKLWIALAQAERKLGLNITDEQIDEMKSHRDDINYDVASKREREVRHDVMAHVYAYGVQCPKAKPIIHLGATSCYVGDNTDLIIMREALYLIKKKLVNAILSLRDFALKYKSSPTLGLTHLQPAQLTTVGKRACLWIQDLMMDLELIDFEIDHMQFLGVKGTTGTQASFLDLFDGDQRKVKQLDLSVTQAMGFDKPFAVSGQTYPRKVDSRILNVLSQIAQSAYKFSNDIRVLQSMKEIEEPFEEEQIGSSAMAYKRNPMRSERMASLCRYVEITSLNAAMTSSTQFFERTLDDSANRRIVIPEAFMGCDAILNLYINIVSGLVVYRHVIDQHISNELPFMATENILMEAVKNGGDRQELHERIRIHSMEAGRAVKEKGLPNDLIDRINADPMFNLKKEDILTVLKPENYIGRAPEQVDEYIEDCVNPTLEKNRDLWGVDIKIEV